MTTRISEPAGTSATAALKEEIRKRGLTAGFEAVRFTTPAAIPEASARLADFLAKGRHGDMAWMARETARSGDPSALWPEARSVIVMGLNYGPTSDPMASLDHPSQSTISVYARGKDYHDVIKKKLKQVAGWLHQTRGCEVKVFVDTAPVMEKPLAQAAGLGWQGKHTNLVSRAFGSWLFIGSIFTTEFLPADKQEADHCGACNRCLEVCPTNAFPKPYELDARRCISYLTIEHKGHIAEEFRTAMGNRVFGCDDCLAVCPWNKFAQASREVRLAARSGADNPPLADLLKMDDVAFRARFAGTPVKRTGRDRFIRNVLIAAGNSDDAALVRPVEKLLDDKSPLVRAMAVWALARLLSQREFISLGNARSGAEGDPAVSREWKQGGVCA